MTMASLSPDSTGDEITTRPLTRLRHEYVRAWLAVAITFPLSFLASAGLTLFYGRPSYPLAVLFSWVLWGGVYALLTMRAYGGVTADQLPAMVSTRRVRKWQRVVAGGSDGPGFAVQLAVMAMAAAALLPRVEALAPAVIIALMVSALID
ncbi:MAG TPA: hypothetical protein VGR21_13915 [Cryptosporangiaceae bacterium]|nr:hypothetical protein [Cryptosporangiaceae bacterium]